MDPSRLPFWRSWRRDVVRGAVLFAVVVAAGVLVTRAIRGARDRLVDLAGLTGLSELAGIGDFDFEATPSDSADAFHWAGRLTQGATLWVRNVNGPVVVEGARGDSAVVSAFKYWRRSDPAAVRLVVQRDDSGLTVCALWPGHEHACGPRGAYRVAGVRGNDVSVRLVVRVPRGVRVEASTVSGRVQVAGTSMPVAAKTLNGDVDISTSAGSVVGVSVNGAVRAAVGELRAADSVRLKTINGAIEMLLPAGAHADLKATTVSGEVRTDLPLRVEGRASPRRLQGRLGTGGAMVDLTTVNGSIRLAAHPTPPR